MVDQNGYIKSYRILHDNIDWLLNSDIRIRKGPNKGALYGWKNPNPPSFPFIYSEITGYGITCFSWIASEFGNRLALDAAKEAASWIERNLHSNLLFARPAAKKHKPNKLSEIYYSFDNGMAIIGMLNLYKITNDVTTLALAEKMSQSLIYRFFDGEKLNPRLDMAYNKMSSEKENEIVKWSTVPGPYHCKISLGLLYLSKLTDIELYGKISDSLCDYAVGLQKADGSFITNPGHELVYLHPHLYSCEGLVYSGLMRPNRKHLNAGLAGLRWAVEQLKPNSGGLCQTTAKDSAEQSDCTAQLLRLLILCRLELERVIPSSTLENVIEKLHTRLLDFCIKQGRDQGGVKYQLSTDSICSWCTMFSLQALRLFSTRHSNVTWIDSFI